MIHGFFKNIERIKINKGNTQEIVETKEIIHLVCFSEFDMYLLYVLFGDPVHRPYMLGICLLLG
jgi:hypothetical protein